MSTAQVSEVKVARSSKTGISESANFGLAALHVTANIFQFFILPIYLLPRTMWWSIALIVVAALNNPFWALVHEAIHDVFNSSSRINLASGRLLSIFFGSPFHILRLTHLSHHKFNRSPLEKGTEIYDPRTVSRFKACISYYFYIVAGLYLLEVFSTMLFFLPARFFSRLRQRLIDEGNIQEKWLATKFSDEKIVREIRVDGLAICLVFALSAYCYRGHWLLFMDLLCARTFLISFMDNVYHYRTTLYATVSGHNLWLPPFLSKLLLNFNLHRIHHRSPSVPWTKLPELFIESSEKFDRSLLTAAFQQLYGPIPAPRLAPREVLDDKLLKVS